MQPVVLESVVSESTVLAFVKGLLLCCIEME